MGGPPRGPTFRWTSGDPDLRLAVGVYGAAAFAITVGLNVYLDDPIWHTLPLLGGIVYLLLSAPVALRNHRRPVPDPDELTVART